MQHDSACEGWVVHRRSRPTQHAFRYRVWMLLFDMDRGWGRRFAPLAVDRGHVMNRNELARELVRHGAAAHPGRVLVLTQPRSVGVSSFNPVNFYFCYDDDTLTAIVAHITNTPWEETHTYVLTPSGNHLQFEFDKAFHVSPFAPMNIRYRWRFRLTERRIHVAMRLFHDGSEQLFAGLYLDVTPMSTRHLWRAVWRYPVQNARTLIRIYWQAARLFAKHTPFHRHPDGPVAGKEAT